MHAPAVGPCWSGCVNSCPLWSQQMGQSTGPAALSLKLHVDGAGLAAHHPPQALYCARNTPALPTSPLQPLSRSDDSSSPLRRRGPPTAHSRPALRPPALRPRHLHVAGSGMASRSRSSLRQAVSA